MELTLEQFNAALDKHAEAVGARLEPQPPLPQEAQAHLSQEDVLTLRQLIQNTISAPSLKKPDPEPEVDSTGDEDNSQPASMGRGPLAGPIGSLDNAAGQDIPWGSALFGGFSALVLSELIDGFVSPVNTSGGTNMVNVLVKLGGAVASVKLVPMLATRQAGQISAAVMVFSAARSLLPIDQWVAQLTGLVPGTGTTAASSQLAQAVRAAQLGSPTPMNQVVPGHIGTRVDVLGDVLSPD